VFSLGVFSAVPMEILGILDELKAVKVSVSKDEIAGLEVFRAEVQGKEVLFASLGIGIVRFSFNLGIVLGGFDLKKAILVGTAGVFPHSKLKVGDVAVADIESFWEARDQRMIPHLPIPVHMQPQRPRYWEGITRFLKHNAIPFVPMLTVLNPSKDMDEAEGRGMESEAECENMEGYCFYLCLNTVGLYGLEIRSISNIAGERDKSKWDMPKACGAIKEVMLSILEEGAYA